MRFIKTNNKFFSLAKRNKNSFWVEQELFDPEYECHHFEVSYISWRRYKKAVLKEFNSLV